MTSLPDALAFLAVVSVPFIVVRLFRRRRWALEALAAVSGWRVGADGRLSACFPGTVATVGVSTPFGHTFVDVRLRFPSREAARAALRRVPAAARVIPVAQSALEGELGVVVRFAWETLVIPAALVRQAIAELAAGTRDALAPPLSRLDPVYAAVARAPELAPALLLILLLGAGYGFAAASLRATSLTMTFVAVFLGGHIVRRALGLSTHGGARSLEVRLLTFVAVFAVIYLVVGHRPSIQVEALAAAYVGSLALFELTRARRAVRIALRLGSARGGWIRVTGTVVDPDRGQEPRPFLLTTPTGDFWVEAGPTHTLLAGGARLLDGDRVEVIGRAAALPQDGAYRACDRRVLTGDADAPLSVAPPGAHPTRWIALEGLIATAVAAGYAGVVAYFVAG